MNNHVKYYKNNSEYFKVNSELKRITKIQDNIVEYLDYDTHVETVQSYKKTNMSEWKHIENSFFISKHFEWEHQGTKYRTTDKPIQWRDNRTYSREAFIFHNGKIWEATYSANYYPRIQLRRIETISNHVKESDYKNSEEWFNAFKLEQRQNTKWTDIKYCRAFEKIEEEA